MAHYSAVEGKAEAAEAEVYTHYRIRWRVSSFVAAMRSGTISIQTFEQIQLRS
jgi:hypothetical protein